MTDGSLDRLPRTREAIEAGIRDGLHLGAQIFATISSQEAWGQPVSSSRMPPVWVRRWRRVIPSLPLAANSGMCRATGSSSSSSPRSQSWAMATAGTGLVEESQSIR